MYGVPMETARVRARERARERARARARADNAREREREGEREKTLINMQAHNFNPSKRFFCL